nr:hypothetical protein [Glycomyces sp. NRRL B-16210]
MEFQIVPMLCQDWPPLVERRIGMVPSPTLPSPVANTYQGSPAQPAHRAGSCVERLPLRLPGGLGGESQSPCEGSPVVGVSVGPASAGSSAHCWFAAPVGSYCEIRAPGVVACSQTSRFLSEKRFVKV